MVTSLKMRSLAAVAFIVAALWLVRPDVVAHAALTIVFMALGIFLVLLGLYLVGAGPAVSIVLGALRALLVGLWAVVVMVERRSSPRPEPEQVDAKPVLADGPPSAISRRERQRRPHLRLIVNNSERQERRVT
jgi:hypothetical protein